MYSPLVHALRLARRAPAVVCAAVVALAIGIAGNTIIFSVVDAALLRAVPYDRPDRLVSIEEYLTAVGSGWRVLRRLSRLAPRPRSVRGSGRRQLGNLQPDGAGRPRAGLRRQRIGVLVPRAARGAVHGSSIHRRGRIVDGGAGRHPHVRFVARPLSARSRDHRPHRRARSRVPHDRWRAAAARPLSCGRSKPRVLLAHWPAGWRARRTRPAQNHCHRAAWRTT